MLAHTLTETSPLYYSQAAVYARFAECEDRPGEICALLAPYVHGRDVLDLGCGTGKYVRLLSPSAKSYHALDISPDVLALARKAAGLTRVNFICSSAERIPLPDASLDMVFACWVLGTIREKSRREQVLTECRRVLRPGGRMLLIENDLGGEFEMCRGRCPDVSATKAYNDWVQASGFVPQQKIRTYFKFSSAAEAKAVFSAIWGASAGARVSSNVIQQRVVAFQQRS